MKKKKQTWFKRFFSSKMFVLAAFVLVLLMVFFYFRSFYQDYKIRHEISQLEDQIRKLEGKKLESVEILSYVMEQGFVEQKAREELNMKKPGESVIVFNNTQSSDRVPDYYADDNEEEGSLTNPEKWFKYFIHR